MVKKLCAVLIVLLLMLPLAVSADEQGSMEVEETGVEIFTQTLSTSSGSVSTHDIDLGFPQIEYYAEIESIVMDFDIRGGAEPTTIFGPTGFDGSHTTDFIANCDGNIVGSGEISLLKGLNEGQWVMTLIFDSWDVGDLTGAKTVILDYGFGDGVHTKLYSTIQIGSYTTGSHSLIYPIANGGYLWAWEPPYNTIDVQIYYTKSWQNLWDVSEITDISDSIQITKNINGRAYTSDITILTPLNTYELGSNADDIELTTVGRPIYIYVTDIYSNEYLQIAYDDGFCSFSGTVYDVSNGSTLDGATVVATQNSVAVGQLTDTTDSAGAYNYIGVPLQETTILSTSKTGYTSQDLTFAPPWSQDWVFDLYMWPDDMSWNGSAVGGIAYEQGSSQGVAAATVHIWNDTFSTNVTANSVGYYLVDNLTANTTYSVQATEINHRDSDISYAETAPDTFTQTDVALQGIYTLTVSVRNSETGTLLDNTTAHITLSDGQDATTSTGVQAFNVSWGTYTVTASADGYYSGSEYVAVDEDATVTVNLVQTSTSGAGAYYPPHNVRFHVQDEFGNPLSGLLITAVYQETSGPIEWLQELFGLPSSVEVENTTLSGTTGEDGSITFSMVEVVQYQVTASNATAGLSHSFLLYPKEDQYTIRFTLADKPDMSLYPVYSVTAFDINDSYVGLNVYYNDTLTSSTDSFTFTIVTGNKTPVYSAELSDQTINVTYSVENVKGDSYYWGFTAEHTIYGEITSIQGLTLKGGTGRIVDLELDEGDEVWYIYLSMMFTGLIAGLFSISNVKMGAIMIPLCAGFFFFIGWLPAAMAGVLAAAFAFGVLIYMRKSEYKLRSGY